MFIETRKVGRSLQDYTITLSETSILQDELDSAGGDVSPTSSSGDEDLEMDLIGGDISSLTSERPLSDAADWLPPTQASCVLRCIIARAIASTTSLLRVHYSVENVVRHAITSQVYTDLTTSTFDAYDMSSGSDPVSAEIYMSYELLNGRGNGGSSAASALTNICYDAPPARRAVHPEDDDDGLVLNEEEVINTLGLRDVVTAMMND